MATKTYELYFGANNLATLKAKDDDDAREKAKRLFSLVTTLIPSTDDRNINVFQEEEDGN